MPMSIERIAIEKHVKTACCWQLIFWRFFIISRRFGHLL